MDVVVVLFVGGFRGQRSGSTAVWAGAAMVIVSQAFAVVLASTITQTEI